MAKKSLTRMTWIACSLSMFAAPGWADGTGALQQLEDMAGPEAVTSIVKDGTLKPVSIKDGEDARQKILKTVQNLYAKGEKPTVEDFEGLLYGYCINWKVGNKITDMWNVVLDLQTRPVDGGPLIGIRNEPEYATISSVGPLDAKGRLSDLDTSDVLRQSVDPSCHYNAAMLDDSLHLSWRAAEINTVFSIDVKKSGQYLVSHGYSHQAKDGNQDSTYCYFYTNALLACSHYHNYSWLRLFGGCSNKNDSNKNDQDLRGRR